MEVVDEEVADIPVDVALADEAEGYMVMVDNFVMMEAVDEEVTDVPVDVAVAGEPEGYTVRIRWILGMIQPKKPSNRQQDRSLENHPRQDSHAGAAELAC